jgi:serine/threonine protein kinase
MPSSDPPLPAGTIVLDDVRLDSWVCGRGLGALYLGTSTSSGARLWVRVMSASALSRTADLFAREVSVARHVEHPGVLAPLDAGVAVAANRAEGIVIYEPCKGASLQALAAEGRMPVAEVARIVTELASILDHAHRQPAPLVHGALSTGSVILAGKSREARLLDLGIVQALDRVDLFDEAKWELLDPSAFAPEQVSRAFPIGPATDVFGLASIAFECLTGHVAFPATNPAEAEALMVGARPSAHQLRRELPANVDRLLARAWSVDPRSRPTDIIAFARVLAGELVPQAPDSLFDDEATVNRSPEPAPKAPRAHTLPFGMPALAPSDPPPQDRPTVSKLAAANPPEPAPPRADPPPPPAAEQSSEVRTVRVVNVTAMLVALLLAGAIVIAGGMVAASRFLRTPPPTPTPAPAPSPAPAPTPSSAPAAASASASAPASASASASASAPASAFASASVLWPPMPKEPGPRPSAKSVETMQSRLRTAIEPCMKITPRPPPGMPWMIHFEIDGATGSPALVEVSRPYKGTVAGACITRAALDARVPPFNDGRWATDLRFGP